MREAALHAALDEMIAWLETATSQVAIFDATNSTESRRQTLVCLQPMHMHGVVHRECSDNFRYAVTAVQYYWLVCWCRSFSSQHH